MNKQIATVMAVASLFGAGIAHAQQHAPTGSLTEGSPSSQNAGYRNSNRATDRINDSQNSGNSAGTSWGSSKEPIAKGVVESGPVRTPYFEYGYMNIDEDVAGTVPDGHQHHYALGYDVAWSNGLLLGMGYEFADRRLEDEPVARVPQSFDSHTISAYGSYPLFGKFYGSLSGGYTDGSFTTAAPSVPYDISTWYVSPGIFTGATFGNLAVNAGVSYLYSDSDYSTGANIAYGQLVPQLGARYLVSDSVFIGSKIQYNGIVDDDDLTPGTVDEQWWRASGEVGVILSSSAEVKVGVDYDFADRIYDNMTGRIGLSLHY